MARIINKKELVNTRLAASYGGWMYCTACGENVGYMCYATYDKVDFRYECNCSSHGMVLINFEDSIDGNPCEKELITLKNRLCCPEDKSPLITVLSKKLKNYTLEISCKECGNIYKASENQEINN